MTSPLRVQTPSFVEANGVRFAYFEEGTGPLVLLLHGFPDTAHTWDAVRPALARAGYRAVSPFTRGYAPSSIPKDGAYDTDTLGADALALIEALGETKAIVVGHDWGASAAYAAASLGPERVELLVTLAIPHVASLKPSLSIAWGLRHFLWLRLPGAAERMRATDFAYVDVLVHRWSPAWKVPAGETDAVKASFREPGSVEAALGYYRDATLSKPPRSLRSPIRVPTVSFSGATDILPRSAFERAKSWFSSRYEIVDMPGGHFMHREDPDKFITELIAVLKRR